MTRVEGLTTIASRFDPKGAMDRVQAEMGVYGLTCSLESIMPPDRRSEHLPRNP